MEKNVQDDTSDESKINYRGWKAMPFVIGNETFEKLGTTGTSNNLLVYLTVVFNMKSITAATLINIFNGTTNFATIVGAFLCDSYFGRYKTLGFASISSFLGMLLLALTAAISNLHPPRCFASDNSLCTGPTTWQMVFLLSGFGFLIVGAGGIRPCNLAFGADQFDPKTESGKRGINSFFNWYYFTFTFAMMVSLTVIVYVQTDISWAWGFAIPAFMMFLSCALFFLGSRVYVKVRPDGSPATSVVQVLVAAIRKRRSKTPEEPWLSLFNHFPSSSINSRLTYTSQFRCLDKAAILTADDETNTDGSARDPWKLSTMQKVEEVKCIIRLTPIWFAALIYYLAIIQQQTYVVFQALQSDRRLGTTNFKIPAATYNIFTMISLTLWIPIYDRVITKYLLQRFKTKRGTRGITILQRMGIGMVISVGTMILSGLVENKRRHLALTNPVGVESRRGSISALSGLWLIPQLGLIGLSEAFTVIGQIELYYKEFPENMRSIAGSFSFVGFALSNYLSGLIITLVHGFTAGSNEWLPEDLNEGRLDYFYYLVAGIGAVNFCFFVLCAKWYKYKGVDGSDYVTEVNMVGGSKAENPLV